MLNLSGSANRPGKKREFKSSHCHGVAPGYRDLLRPYQKPSDVTRDATHLNELKEQSTYRMVAPEEMGRFHEAILRYWHQGIVGYLNECFSAITRFVIDVDSFNPVFFVSR